MSKFTVFTSMVSKKASIGGLVLKKHSPTILMFFGIIGIPVGIVLACNATLELDAILDENKKEVARIKAARDDKALLSYAEDEANRDLVLTYVKTTGTLAKVYAPAIVVTVISISCLLGSHAILRKRNMALAAAYKIIDESFKKYRARVIEEYGVDKDREYRTGVKLGKLSVTETDADGKEKTEVVDITTFSPSGYSRIFDETNPQHSDSNFYNKQFLILHQEYMNQMLTAKGYLFLNTVYEELGFASTDYGQLVGWVTGEYAHDGYVDFGMFDFKDETGQTKQDFINLKENCTFLDFNVDGVIYDLLKEKKEDLVNSEWKKERRSY